MKKKREKFLQRKRRVRAKIAGTKNRPRLSVYRSNRSIFAQIIDDTKGTTLVSVSSKNLQAAKTLTKTEIAFEVGRILAQKALRKRIKKLAFDRGGYKFHGRVRTLAEGAKKGGLEF